MSDDRVRLKAGPVLKVKPVGDDELARHVHEVNGGWTCDHTAGGCGVLLATGVPPLQAVCGRCGREWSLRGGRPYGGTGTLLVWYVPRAKASN